MKKPMVISLMLCGTMVLSSALGKIMVPTEMLADEQAKFTLEQIVPASFGDWTIDTSLVPVQVSPDVQARLDKIYGQTLARTYINSQGQRVMLSLAYGGDQSDYMAVHKPEVCYAAQGFEVGEVQPAQVRTAEGIIPIKRMVAVSGARSEPVTYWIRLGDRAITTGLDQKLRRLSYTLAGKVPDGMLVRVSSIDRDAAASYALQDGFINSMLAAMPAADRYRLTGTFTVASN
jgi:EpsI family protein